MLIFKTGKRRYVAGQGFMDTISKAIAFIAANKDTIKDISEVAKAGASTVASTKQIVDTIRAKREGGQISPQARKALSQKSKEILQNLAKRGDGFKIIKKI